MALFSSKPVNSTTAVSDETEEDEKPDVEDLQVTVKLNQLAVDGTDKTKEDEDVKPSLLELEHLLNTATDEIIVTNEPARDLELDELNAALDNDDIKSEEEIEFENYQFTSNTMTVEKSAKKVKTQKRKQTVQEKTISEPETRKRIQTVQEKTSGELKPSASKRQRKAVVKPKVNRPSSGESSDDDMPWITIRLDNAKDSTPKVSAPTPTPAPIPVEVESPVEVTSDIETLKRLRDATRNAAQLKAVLERRDQQMLRLMAATKQKTYGNLQAQKENQPTSTVTTDLGLGNQVQQANPAPKVTTLQRKLSESSSTYGSIPSVEVEESDD